MQTILSKLNYKLILELDRHLSYEVAGLSSDGNNPTFSATLCSIIAGANYTLLPILNIFNFTYDDKVEIKERE